MKKLVQSLVLCGLVSGSAVAMAEDSPHSISGNVSLTSDYIFRGITQSSGDPAIQGGLDYAHSSGFYAGTWASSVDWLTSFQGYDSGSMEIDLYAGFGGGIGDTGLTYDVGLIRYMYPGNAAGAVKGDTSEAYGSLGWKWFTVKYSYYLSDDVFGVETGGGGNYLDLSASLPVGETGLSLGAHWGKFDFKDESAADYKDWKISAEYDLAKLGSLGSGMTVGVAYSDTDADAGGFWDDTNTFLGDKAWSFWVSKSL